MQGVSEMLQNEWFDQATCFQLALMVTKGGLHLYLRILNVWL